jgi:hypothetical protein
MKFGSRTFTLNGFYILVTLAVIATLSGCFPKAYLTRPEFSVYYYLCGGLGEACCKAPGTHSPELGPLVACKNGLGCDITTNKCVQPCGANGEVCCDGPETRAVKWTADGKVYSPNTWNMIEMCHAGACDIQTHRCFSCGVTDGQACCPPDAAQATARCIGDYLECEYSYFSYKVGTCRACGSRNKPPCRWGCDNGLELRKGLCDICGADQQPPCDRGCNLGLHVANGLCRQCGGNNQIPCDSGCNYPLKIKNQLCVVCGGNNQQPCDFGCDFGMKNINGVCKPCGNTGQPPCAQTCNYPLKPVNGVCMPCGANGQIPCDSGCNHGLVVKNGVCALPTPEQPQTCATLNQPCVANHVSGMHCCENGAPLLCVYGQCRACVPHGSECALGATQLCCDAKNGDSCVLDQASEKVVCGIPG